MRFRTAHVRGDYLRFISLPIPAVERAVLKKKTHTLVILLRLFTAVLLRKKTMLPGPFFAYSTIEEGVKV